MDRQLVTPRKDLLKNIVGSIVERQMMRNPLGPVGCCQTTPLLLNLHLEEIEHFKYLKQQLALWNRFFEACQPLKTDPTERVGANVEWGETS